MLHSSTPMARDRNGSALVAALALLALSAALLTGTSSSARAASRSQRSLEAQLLANAELRRLAADFAANWSSSANDMTIGASLVEVRPVRTSRLGALPIIVRTHLLRVTERRYVVGLEIQVGINDAVLSRRRAQLVLERASQTDSLVPMLPPIPTTKWTLSDIY